MEGEATKAVEVVDMGAALAVRKQEMEIEVATAKRYPRDLRAFPTKVTQMAMTDAEVAASCFYVLERKKKGKGGAPDEMVRIQGMSVRFAEIVGHCWGNLQFGARVIEVGEKFLVAEAIVRDLENNNRGSQEVRRSISGKYGRFSDDMIVTTANAACSIALRNALFKVVPPALVKGLWDQVVAFAIGDERTVVTRRDKALAKFSEKGITAQQILHRLGLRDLAEIKLKEIQTLLGIWSLLDQGESTVEDEFPSAPAQEPVQAASPEPTPTPTPEAEQAASARQALLKDYQTAFNILVGVVGQDQAEKEVKELKGRKGIPSMNEAELRELGAKVLKRAQVISEEIQKAREADAAAAGDPQEKDA